MFEKFSEESIRIIMTAQKTSKILGHNFVGSEQLLVGLIENNSFSSAKILNYLGVKLQDVCEKVFNVCGLGSGMVAFEPPFTPQVKKIFENAAKIAENDGIFVKPEHILASICFSEEKCASLNFVKIECIAQKILQELGVRLIDIERLIIEKKIR